MRALLSLVAVAAVVVTACAPESRIVPCENDGQCKEISSVYRFCTESRCVECVGRGSCGGHACVEGKCEH